MAHGPLFSAAAGSGIYISLMLWRTNKFHEPRLEWREHLLEKWQARLHPSQLHLHDGQDTEPFRGSLEMVMKTFEDLRDFFREGFPTGFPWEVVFRPLRWSSHGDTRLTSRGNMIWGEWREEELVEMFCILRCFLGDQLKMLYDPETFLKDMEKPEAGWRHFRNKVGCMHQGLFCEGTCLDIVLKPEVQKN